MTLNLFVSQLASYILSLKQIQYKYSDDLDLGWYPSRYQFHTRPVLGITFPKFQLNRSNIQMTLNLTLRDTLLDIIFIPALSSGLLSPSFSSIGAIWNLTWPWPWWPNKHKLGVSRTKLHPPTKFEERGTYSLRAKWWTDRQTSKQTLNYLYRCHRI